MAESSVSDEAAPAQGIPLIARGPARKRFAEQTPQFVQFPEASGSNRSDVTCRSRLILPLRRLDLFDMLRWIAS
jgi:hypothetical protein